jgi:hypothetical protein
MNRRQLLKGVSAALAVSVLPLSTSASPFDGRESFVSPDEDGLYVGEYHENGTHVFVYRNRDKTTKEWEWFDLWVYRGSETKGRMVYYNIESSRDYSNVKYVMNFASQVATHDDIVGGRHFGPLQKA